MTSARVRRADCLAFLAPDIVRRIVRGDHPLELNASRLIGMVPLPLAWEEQRALHGLPGWAKSRNDLHHGTSAV